MKTIPPLAIETVDTYGRPFHLEVSNSLFSQSLDATLPKVFHQPKTCAKKGKSGQRLQVLAASGNN